MQEIQKLIDLLKIEEECQKKFYSSSLENDSLKSRVEKGVSVYPINIQKKSFGLGSYPFIEAKHHQNNTRLFKSGSPIELFCNQDGEDENKIKGVLQFVTEDKIGITLYKDDFPDWINDGKIGVNANFDNATFELTNKALNHLLDPNSTQKELLKYFYQKDHSSNTGSSFANQNLNESQNIAVNDIISENSVSVVHGPPGTGKTTVITEAINVLAKQKKTILACAPSNAAVNHLAYKLKERGLNVIRIGNPGKLTSEVRELSLEQRIQNHDQFKLVKSLTKQADDFRKMSRQYKRKFGKEERIQRNELRKEVRKLQQEIKQIELFITEDVLSKADVVCGTIIGAYKMYNEQEAFDFVFLDEAGQSTPAESWVCGSIAEKLVLAGDPHQLPPTLFSDDAAKNGLQVSLIEYWNNTNKPTSLLQVQYRMNPLINEFSNQYFYKGKVATDESIVTRSNESDEFKAIEFIDTAGCDYTEELLEGGSIINRGESDLVIQLLERFINNEDSIGIISPYRAQVHLLQDNLPELKDQINTVDSFQGQERDVIVLSLVRSNNDQKIGFLSDYRRMNVAMTRARKKLIIISDSATVGNDEFYRKLLDFIEDQCSYRSAWEFMT